MSEAPVWEDLLVIPFVILLLGIYFLPTFIAKGKRNSTAILWVNLFFGVTGGGWVVTLIWACVSDRIKNVNSK